MVGCKIITYLIFPMHADIKKASITVIIPVLNGSKTLGELFAALHRQTIQPIEIVVGDSSSTDNSVQICLAQGAKILSFSRQEFDHGGTRTLLAKKAVGDILVYLTQDAIFATRNALEMLICNLLQDDRNGCAYGRQLPQKDATLIASHLRRFNYPGDSSTRSYADRAEYGLKTIFISNSFAAYRKECLREVDYFKNGLIFGEDTCTLGKLLLAGYRVAYVSDAAVYHSHNYTFGEEFRRSFDIGVLHSSEKWLLNTYGSAEGIGAEYVRSALKMVHKEKKYYLMIDCLMRCTVKMLGYKSGRSFTKIPTTVRPFFSMHKLWWVNHK